MTKPVSHKRANASAFHFAQELRHNQSPAEKILWSRLRNHQLNGYGFRRQHAIGPFVVDFCCPALKLVIEVDGYSHFSQSAYDQQRTAWLEGKGWQVVRFWNTDVEKNLEAVLQAILERTPSQPPPAEDHR